MKISAGGFESITSKVYITLGNTTLTNFTLPIGTTTELVEIKAATSLDIKTESSTNIDNNLIEKLPINQRNFLDFALITPRAIADRLPAMGVVQTSGLSINGQSARFNNLTIDGLANNDYVTGSTRSTFSQEAVQEFQVVSDSYSAEFGRALGGVVNIITKSGTNQFHNSFFFFQRGIGNARNAFQ